MQAGGADFVNGLDGIERDRQELTEKLGPRLADAEAALHDERSKSLFDAETVRQRGRLLFGSAAASAAVWFEQIPKHLPLLGTPVEEPVVVGSAFVLIAYQLSAFLLPAWGQANHRDSEIQTATRSLEDAREQLRKLYDHKNPKSLVRRLGALQAISEEDAKKLTSSSQRRNHREAAQVPIGGIKATLQTHRELAVRAGADPGDLTRKERQHLRWSRFREYALRSNQTIDWWWPIVLAVSAPAALARWWLTHPNP